MEGRHCLETGEAAVLHNIGEEVVSRELNFDEVNLSWPVTS